MSHSTLNTGWVAGFYSFLPKIGGYKIMTKFNAMTGLFIIALVALGLFAGNMFGVGPFEKTAEERASVQQTVLQKGTTETVDLAAYLKGLNLATRSQLATSYIVYQGSSIKQTGTLSASATVDFIGKTDDAYDWVAYDDTDTGSDYYLGRGDFVAEAGATPEINVWQEVTPSSHIAATFLEESGTTNDGIIAIGSSGTDNVGFKVKLSDVNKKYANLFACSDFDLGNFTRVDVVGQGVAPMADKPSRLSSYEDCFDLGKSLPTAESYGEGASTEFEVSIVLEAKAGANPVQNVTLLVGDKTEYIDATSGLPNGKAVAEDKDNNDVGADDITFSLNVQ